MRGERGEGKKEGRRGMVGRERHRERGRGEGSGGKEEEEG